MRQLYSLGIRLYSLAIRMASLANPKAKSWIEGRHNLIPEDLQDKNFHGCIWIHCASLGEFEQGRPVLERIKRESPESKILLTFFSPSGYEIRKNYPLADAVVYLPLDLKKNAAGFLDFFQPSMAIFVKYEVWHNFFQEINRRKIPLFLISAIFRTSQIYFKPYGKWFVKSLRQVDTIFVQDEESKILLNQIGLENAVVSGDTRFDRVFELAKNAEFLKELEQFINSRLAIVGGSTWPADEKLFIEYIKKGYLKADQCVVLVPHEVSKQHIDTLKKELPDAALWSEKNLNPEKQVLIIDVIGILGRAYKSAAVVFVGGGYGAGIHNTLEPASFGIPVFFGPRYDKFAEAKGLIAQGGAKSILGFEEFSIEIQKIFGNPAEREKMGIAAESFVNKRKGATEKIVGRLRKYLPGR